MYCTQCGQPTSDDNTAKYCRSCGAELYTFTPPGAAAMQAPAVHAVSPPHPHRPFEASAIVRPAKWENKLLIGYCIAAALICLLALVLS